MTKSVNIVEFPSNLGLIEKEHEAEPGVRKLPDRLRKFGFIQEYILGILSGLLRDWVIKD